MIYLGHTTVEAVVTVFGAALGAVFAVLGASWLARRADKKDRDEHQARTEYLLQEYGFHDHTEPEGPLSVEGIRRPRTNSERRNK